MFATVEEEHYPMIFCRAVADTNNKSMDADSLWREFYSDQTFLLQSHLTVDIL